MTGLKSLPDSSHQPATDSRRLSFLARLAALPATILLGLIVLFWLQPSDMFLEAGWLLPVLNGVFITGICLLVTHLAFSTYLRGGPSGGLFIGCGMLAMATGSLVAGIVVPTGRHDFGVTVYNLAMLVGGLCNLLSALGGEARAEKPAPRRNVALACGATLAVMAVIIALTPTDIIPAFFIEGSGPTPLRQAVLGVAIGLMLVSAALFFRRYARTRDPFFYWYTLGLASIAIGLAGVMNLKIVDDLPSWLGRGGQYLGCLYILFGVIGAYRRSQRWELPLAQALRETRERYRMLTEAAYEGIVVHADGVVLDANRQFAQMHGWAPQEVIGRRITDFITPESLPQAQANADSGQAQEGEYEDVCRDGRRIWVQARGNPIVYEGRAARVTVMRDITASKQADEALRQSEARFRALFERSLDAVFLTMPDGKVLAANPAACAMFGMTEAEISCAGRQGLVDADDPRFHAAMAERQRLGYVSKVEMRFIRGNGQRFPAEVDSIIVPGPQACAFAIVRDITERKEAEADREASVQLLRLINRASSAAELAAAALAFFQKETSCRVVGIRLKDGDDYPYYNCTGLSAEFLQKENSLLSPQPCGSLICDGQAGPYLECMCGNVICGRTDPRRPFFTAGGSFFTNSTTEFLASTTDVDRMTRTRNVCNHVGFESLALVPLRAGAQTLGLLHLADPRRDMFSPRKIAMLERLADHLGTALAKARAEEARQRAEASLRESQERLHIAMRAANLAAWEINLQTQEVLHSPELLEAFGVASMDAVELRDQWRQRIHEEDRSLVRQAVEEAKQGKHFHIQYRIRWPDGSIRWHDSTAAPLAGPDGQYVRLVGMLADITERKGADEALRRTAEELARSNKDLEQFAYIASHDLQEPLRMVTGFLGLLRNRYQGKLDAKADEFIGISVEAAERMSQMIVDLLAYSRAGSQTGRQVPVAFEGVVARAQANLRAAIAESQAVITHDPLPTVTADASQMTQVFQNLIANAVKFRAPGRAPKVHIAACPQGGGWLFRVTDNGIGIDPAHTGRLFAIFQRLHARQMYPGTGIGLAVCKKIIERHGGRIWVESKPDEGSTFCFTLHGTGSTA